MTGLGATDYRHPTPANIDAVAGTIRALETIRMAAKGDPAELQRAAGFWDRASSDLDGPAGIRGELEVEHGRLTRVGFKGQVRGAVDEAGRRLADWMVDVSDRQKRTASSLRYGADCLTRCERALVRIEADFLQQVQAARGQYPSNPATGDLAFLAAAGTLGKEAIATAEETVRRLDQQLESVTADVRKQNDPTGPVGGDTRPYNVSLFGRSLFPRSWLPDLHVDSIKGMLWPQEPSRLVLAGLSSGGNIGAEWRRTNSLAYAVMTSPTGLARNLVTDTSEPFVSDPFGHPVSNGLAHAAWGAAGTAATDLGAAGVTRLWGQRLGDAFASRHLFGFSPGDTFDLRTGITGHLATVNASTAFLLTVKDPLFVHAGLASLDASGQVHMNGASGQAASLAYDLAAVPGTAAGVMSLERWNALSHLSDAERWAAVKQTACADWFVGQGGVLGSRAMDPSFSDSDRFSFGLAGAASASVVLTPWCDFTGGSGGGHLPPGGVATAGAPMLLAPPVDTHGINLDAWRTWAFDPELSPSYALTPEFRSWAWRNDLLANGLAFLPMAAAAGAAGAGGWVYATLAGGGVVLVPATAR